MRYLGVRVRVSPRPSTRKVELYNSSVGSFLGVKDVVIGDVRILKCNVKLKKTNQVLRKKLMSNEKGKGNRLSPFHV